MESVPLDMDDLFEDRSDRGRGGDQDDDDFGHHPGLPDLDPDDEGVMRSESHTNNQDGDEVLANLQNLAKGAAKKRVTRPQPKLDPQRLQSDRGLASLQKLFSEVKFRGKGHEAEDLKVLMGKMEHWAHRLFPKLQFDDFIERLEKLGQKKEIQTCLKRIRMDMPLLDSDFVNLPNENDDDNGDSGAALSNRASDNMDVDDVDAEEAYDTLIRQEREKRIGQVEKSPEVRTPGAPTDVAGGPDLDENSSASASATCAISSQKSLSKEQLERMERCRQIALQKRALKFGFSLSTSVSASATNVEVTTTSSSSAEAAATCTAVSNIDCDNHGNDSDELAIVSSDADKAIINSQSKACSPISSQSDTGPPDV